MDILSKINYNAPVILSYFFISLIVLIVNYFTGDKLNKKLFSSYRSSIINPLTYIRLVTHIFGHSGFSHFLNNFLYILLIGPMIEEKFGSIKLIIMILITALVIGIVNIIFSNKRILGASGVVFMLIILSSAVNMESGIPLTLILICLLYVVGEIKDALLKKDNVSHLSHLLGCVCGIIFIFYK